MKLFRADFHVHTVLSPCGSLDMSPGKIIEAALDTQMDIIAITDHNSTRQWKTVMEVGAEKGLVVLGGVEINTQEEVHCLAFFEHSEMLGLFQEYLDKWLPDISNVPEKFGHQVIVNRNEEIIDVEKRLLWSGLNQSIDEVAQMVHSLNGIFIPAHVDRQAFGLYSQLGVYPKGLLVDALEVTPRVAESFLEKTGIKDRFTLVTGSDAHTPEQIGKGYTWLRMHEPSFKEIRLALHGIDNRKAWPNGNLFGNGSNGFKKV